MKPRMLRLTLFAAFLLLVVACAPAPAPTPTSPPPTAAPTATSGPPKLSMTDVIMVSTSVTPPSITNIYYYAAIDRGYFKKYGLNVTPQQSGGSPLSLAAITSGTAQFASVNLGTMANAVAEGAKLKLVVTGSFDHPGSIIANEKIKSEKDLSTATLGMATVGSNEYIEAMTYLKAKGIDTSKTQWVATGSSNLSIQGVASGKIDATWAPEANVVKALNQFPQLHRVVDAKTLSQYVSVTGGIIVVTEDFIAKHPDVVQAFVAAIIEGNRDLQQNESTYTAIAKERMPGAYSDKDIHELWQVYSPSFGVNGGLALDVLGSDFGGWRTQVNPQGAEKAGLKSIDQLVDRRFASVALDKLGIVKGSADTASWK